MKKLYSIYDEDFNIIRCEFYEEGLQPINSTLKLANGQIKPKYDPINDIVYEGATLEEIENLNKDKIALNVLYPELEYQNYKYIMFDKLPGIKRRESLSNKGLKGKYEYEKDGQLIWSIETKFWFDEDSDFNQGLKKICKLYTIGETIYDQWDSYFTLTEDAKQNILKEQREMILVYLKSQQPERFDLLYRFFVDEIDRYIRLGNKQELQQVLEDANLNHPYIQGQLSIVIPTQVEGVTTTILQGILDELV